MKLEWLGEYRDFTEKLIKFGNAYAGMYQIERYYGMDVQFSPAELQALEYILETEDKNQNMAEIAARLGVPPSTFSRNVKKMMGKGLLEKYHTASNRKNIIIRVSPLGRKAYETYSSFVYKYRFQPIFQMLDGVDKEALNQIVQVIDLWAEKLRSHIPDNKAEERETLIRIQ